MESLDITPFSLLTYDSREVVPGALFVALPGTKTDGAAFVAEAVARGASAVVVDQDASLPVLPPGVSVYRTHDPRLSLAQLAARFFPDQPRWIAAVTGTDGKTSTVHFARELLALSGVASASIGTLGVIGAVGQVLEAGTHTTPDPIRLHRTLTGLHKAGVTHVALEASSHGLDQRRLDGVRVAAAAFTNLSRDHLDYHGDIDRYFYAKARLFLAVLSEGGLGVINAEDPRKDALIELLTGRGCSDLRYGAHPEAELRIASIRPLPAGQEVVLEVFGKRHRLSLPLVGNFQVYNMLAAVGLVSAAGFDVHALMALLPQLTGVPGRLQRVGANAYVDYAHTPAALTKALSTLRLHTKGRLWVVFGCGGDRDAGKRSDMGAAAAMLADGVVVTDDNPRSEDPARIRHDVLVACPHAKEIGDRRAAIEYALGQLRSDDALLIAGKGHETEQIYGTVKQAFSDVAVVEAWLAGRAPNRISN